MGFVAGRRLRRVTRPVVVVLAISVALSVLGAVTLDGTRADASAVASPPTDVVVSSDSLGLAVDVTWTAANGALFYNVYRSTDPSVTRSLSNFVGRTEGTSFRDLKGTMGRTWYYTVSSVGANGAESASAPEVTVTTSSDLSDDLNGTVGWLAYQQEAAQGFRVVFDQAYSVDYTGYVSGVVEDADQLTADILFIPFVDFDVAYADDYVGTVSGVWANVPAADFRVDAYVITDIPYLQGSYDLVEGGTWSSGADTMPAGQKVAALVRRADDAIVAVSGDPNGIVDGVVVQVFSRTDVDYLMAEVPLRSDGTWTTEPNALNGSGGTVAAGEKIARLVRQADGRVLNSTEWSDSAGFRGLVRSLFLQQDDPDYGYEGDATQRTGYRLEQRSWIYDDALAVLAFLNTGQTDRARDVLTQLSVLQSPNGSLRFSYDVFRGEVFEEYIRSGALAWVGTSGVEYEYRTGSTEFRAFTTALADYLLSLQITEANGYALDDDRYGSVMGGWGSYAADYSFTDAPVTWASTEHNIDAYFFFRDLGYLTGEQKYTDAAELIKESLLTNHWNTVEGRFNQGVNDPAHALDLASWGGMFLLAVGEEAKAATSLAYLETFRVNEATVALSTEVSDYNVWYEQTDPFDGYRPYRDGSGYTNSPNTVWAEGTWGALLFKARMGQDITADLQSMERFRAADPLGAFLTVSKGAREWPYEFHAWPAVGGTGWAAIVMSDASSLWRADGWPYEAAHFFYVDDSFAFGVEGYSGWDGSVNASLGNFVTANTDVAIDAVGPELAIARTYNSRDPRPGSFGTGWSATHEMTFQEDGFGNITVLWGDGRRETHSKQEDGTFASPEGYFSLLTLTGEGGYTLRMKDRTEYEFGLDGRLTTVRDVAGNEQTLAYQADGLLGTVTDVTSGRSVTLSWADGYVSQIETSPVTVDGVVVPLIWKYYYEGDYLTRVCDPRDNAATGVCTVYEYTDGLMTGVIRPGGNAEVRAGYNADRRVEWRENGVGDRTTYTYDGNRRVTITDPAQNVTVEEHDTRFRQTLATDPLGNSTVFSYDDDGNRDRIIDGNGNVTTTVFDARGNPTSITTGEGHTLEVVDGTGTNATIAFDQTYTEAYEGPVAGTWTDVDPAGYRVDVYSVTDLAYLQGSFSLNADGTWSSGEAIARFGTKVAELVRVSDATLVASTDPAAVIDSPDPIFEYVISGYTSYMDYDTFDNVVAARDARSANATDNTYATSYEYDSYGNTTRITTPATAAFPAGTTQEWDYSTGTELAVGGGTLPPSLLLVSRDGEGGEDQYAYNAQGDLVSTTTATGLTTSFEYDELGRKTAETVTDAISGTITRSEFTYDVMGRTATLVASPITDTVTGETHQLTTTYVYDLNGNVKETIVGDSIGDDPTRTTYFDYDAADREWRVTDPEGGQISRVFDSRGNPWQVTDQEGRTTQTDYDPRGLPDTVTLLAFDRDPADTEPARDIVLADFEYDNAGRKISEVDAAGTTRVWTYDRGDLLVDVTVVAFENLDGTTSDLVAEAYEYDQAGNVVTSWANNHTIATTYTYDQAGRVVASTLDPAGLARVSAHEYDRVGRIVKATITDTSGTTETRYDYDLAGRLEAETVENGTNDLTTSYTYDQRNNQITITGPRGNEPGADPAAHTVSQTFDAANRVIETVSPPVSVESDGNAPAIAQPTIRYGYDTFGNQEAVIDPRGALTRYVFDGLDRLVGVTHSQYTSPTGAVFTPTEHFAYDKVGNKTSEITRRGFQTTWEFDDLNRAYRQTVPPAGPGVFGGVSEIFYDDAGNMTGTQSAQGRTVTYTYDALGRVRTQTEHDTTPAGDPVTFTTTFDYDAAGRKISTQHPDGSTELSRYNADGTVAEYEDPLGIVTTYEYDVAGRPTAMIDTVGRRTESGYDQAGRKTSVSVYAADTTLLSHSETTYDAVGNPTTETDPRGFEVGATPTNYTVTYTYDALNRLTDVTQPLNTSQTLNASYGYDEAGNVTRISDGRQNVTVLTYNVWNLQEDLIEPATTDHPSLADRTYRLGYDAGGLVVYQRQPGLVELAIEHDDLGRVITETATAPLTTPVTRTFAYDLDGLTTAVSHPGGMIVSDYDGRGQLASVTGPAGDATYQYDPVGRLTQRGDATGTTTFEWTARGEMETMNDPISGIRSYLWNDIGQLETVTFGSPSAYQVAFDADYTTEYVGPVSGTWSGPLAADAYQVEVYSVTDAEYLQGTYPVDADGTWTSGEQIARYGDKLVKLVALDLINVVVATNNDPSTPTQTYAYDALGRLDTDVLLDTQNAVAVSYDYDYDATGNVTGQTVTIPGLTTQAGAHLYEYDYAGRLVEWTDPAGVVTGYGWDPSGNRTSAGSDLFTFDERNRLITSPDGTHAYDARGALKSVTSPTGQVTTYTFDAAGRLAAFNDTVTYTYDALDRIAARDTAAFTYSGPSLDPVSDGTDLISRSPGGRILGVTDGTEAYRAGTNRHGDLTYLIGTSGQAVMGRSYGPFGVVTEAFGTVDPTVGFQSDFTDPSSGLVWMGARWYAPQWASFISRDTVGGELRTPVGLNRYTYGFASPMTYWDPDGHWPKWADNLIDSAKDYGRNVVSSARRSTKAVTSAVSSYTSRTHAAMSSGIRNTRGQVREGVTRVRSAARRAIGSVASKATDPPTDVAGAASVAAQRAGKSIATVGQSLIGAIRNSDASIVLAAGQEIPMVDDFLDQLDDAYVGTVARLASQAARHTQLTGTACAVGCGSVTYDWYNNSVHVSAGVGFALGGSVNLEGTTRPASESTGASWCLGGAVKYGASVCGNNTDGFDLSVGGGLGLFAGIYRMQEVWSIKIPGWEGAKQWE